MNLEFDEQCIKAHNELRALHRANPIKLSKRLSIEAQKWAEIMAKNGKLEHSDTNGKYGENIASNSKRVNGEDATLMWYHEIFAYNFGQERQEISKIGHFSQIIWTASEEAGFGIAKVGFGGKFFVVARYMPAGNIMGQFAVHTSAPIQSWGNDPLIKSMKLQYPQHDDSSLYRNYSSVFNSLRSNPSVKKTQERMNQEMNTGSFQNKQDNDKTDSRKPQLQNDFNNDYKSESDNEDEELLELQEKSLTIHNDFRRRHRVNPLKLNKALCRLAQKWAQHLADGLQLSYSNQRFLDTEVGENVALRIGVSGGNQVGAVLEGWYNEINRHNFEEEPEEASETGHFTQMVWSNSKEFGLGMAELSKDQHIFVCYYFPAGNVYEEFRKNVKPTQ